ncbi:B double prime 1, partial [Carabus blaptoides fortunei]
MTSRRARIKGIANIPARRKNDAPNSDIAVKPEPITPEKTVQPLDDVKVEQPTPQKTIKTTGSDKDVKQLSSDNDSKKNSIKTEISSQNNSQPSNLNQLSSTFTNRKSELTVKFDSNNKEIEVFRTADSNVQCADVTNLNETQGESVGSNCEVPKSIGESCTKADVSEKTQEGPKFGRRWVPRPAVKIPVIARRSKPAELPTKESPAHQNIENEEPVAENNDVINIVSSEILSPQRLDPPATLAINKLPSTPDLSIKIPVESDRTLASPLSPSKTLNRTRIRPSPKLVRRNSIQGSASESEDDGRRSRNRIRNDSVCSIASYTTESTPVKDHVSAVRDRINACYKIHKLFRRSEQTRKVAEARREFYQKFGTKIPDKKRLTMMDLIYYNPTSNPMPKKESRTNNELEIIETIADENPEEENEDEPDETNGGEDATPVPQVKVGPNGEIILDEQSLVIEQTGTKKGREKLANSQIVNVDDLDRTYGIYKRPKRAKDWNVVETLRFYKTLNTVGTDFSLMLSLFPGRTRRELKIKFKKEEKLNRALIDKALMNPVEFDFTELEQQLVADEVALAADKEEKEKRKQKVMRQKKRKSA